MSNAIVTLIMAALMLAGVSILGQESFTAFGQVSDAFKDMEVRSGERSRTGLSTLSVSYSTPTLDWTLVNSGSEPLRDFEKWDVLVQYYETDGTYHTAWLAYTTASPVTDNNWTVQGIYLDAATQKAEASQPNILDPEEEMVLRLRVSPAADSTANNLVIAGTPNGVTLSSPF